MSRFWTKFLAGIAEYKQNTSEVVRKWSPSNLVPPMARKVMRSTYDASESWRLPPRSKSIFTFNADTDLTNWQLVDDHNFAGGASFSRIGLLERPDPQDPSKTIHSLVWEGELKPLPSPKVAPRLPFYAPKKFRDAEFRESDNPRPSHVPGFCGLISPKGLYNLELYGTIALQVQTDGRAYLFNVLPDSFSVGEDIYQAAIAAEEPRPMHLLEVDFEQLTQTSKGLVRYYQAELAVDRIKGFSFGVQGEGPFRFELGSMEARVPDFELAPVFVGMHEEQTLLSRLWTIFKPGQTPPTEPDPEILAYYKKKDAEHKIQEEPRRFHRAQEEKQKQFGRPVPKQSEPDETLKS